MAGKTSEVATRDLMNDDVTLREIKSISDALQALSDAGIPVVDSTELGNGFVVIPDKGNLVGVTFVVMGARQTIGDQGEFSILYVMTENGDKWVVTDGGSGIHRQIGDVIEANGTAAGLLVKGGLVRSDYQYVGDDGVGRPATTYYLSGF